MSAWLAYAWASPSDSIWKGKPWSVTARAMFDGLVYASLTAGIFGFFGRAEASRRRRLRARGRCFHASASRNAKSKSLLFFGIVVWLHQPSNRILYGLQLRVVLTSCPRARRADWRSRAGACELHGAERTRA